MKKKLINWAIGISLFAHATYFLYPIEPKPEDMFRAEKVIAANQIGDTVQYYLIQSTVYANRLGVNYRTVRINSYDGHERYGIYLDSASVSRKIQELVDEENWWIRCQQRSFRRIN